MERVNHPGAETGPKLSKTINLLFYCDHGLIWATSSGQPTQHKLHIFASFVIWLLCIFIQIFVKIFPQNEKFYTKI